MYPATVSTTPSTLSNSSAGSQKHPIPKVDSFMAERVVVSRLFTADLVKKDETESGSSRDITALIACSSYLPRRVFQFSLYGVLIMVAAGNIQRFGWLVEQKMLYVRSSKLSSTFDP